MISVDLNHRVVSWDNLRILPTIARYKRTQSTLGQYLQSFISFFQPQDKFLKFFIQFKQIQHLGNFGSGYSKMASKISLGGNQTTVYNSSILTCYFNRIGIDLGSRRF